MVSNILKYGEYKVTWVIWFHKSKWAIVNGDRKQTEVICVADSCMKMQIIWLNVLGIQLNL